MQTTGRRLTRSVNRALGVLLGVGLLVTAGGVVRPAVAADFAGTASVDVHDQFVGDATGTTFTFTVTNTGTLSNIAAVLISRPSSNWTITSCPMAPPGWTASVVKTSTDPGKCRYLSAAGSADDILPAASSSSFQARATNAAGTANFTGNWTVAVSKNGSFGSADALNATAAVAGLRTTAFVWEITDAVVAAGTANVDSACPPPAKNADVSSTRVLVLCGRNHGNGALMPANPPSSLAGTFVGTAGSFLSAAVAARTGAPVVLGNWSGTTVTGSAGPGKTVVATTGSSATATSPQTTLNGYTAVAAVVNNAPVLADMESAALAFTEGDAAKAITSTITVADSDSANLASATVVIFTGYQNGQDVLALPAPPAGITPSFNAGAGTLTLTGTASPADYQAALRAVTFANGSDTPTTTARSIAFQVNDGAASNNLSNVATRIVSVTAVNDAPVLANIEGAALSFSEGDAAKAITSAITVADVDSPNLASATVAITGNYQNGQDVLALSSPPAGITSNFDAGSGTLTLTGSSSVADYQAALRAVTYQNTSGTPNPATRTVSFSVDDGAAANHASNTVTRNITIAAVNSAPVLTDIEGTALAFTEGDGPKAITSTITVTDPDSPNLASATVTISAGYQSGQDVLALPSPPAGITPAFNAATGTLTLSGSASPADYQTALRGITFANGSDTPSTTTRTTRFQVNDGAATNNVSNILTRDITVTAVNDAPVLANVEGAALSVGEGDAPKAITSTVTVADADSANLASATVAITGNYQNGQDVLALPSPPAGITPSFSAATGTLTLTGSASPADYQAALRAVTYQNISGTPNLATRTVSFTVDDGAAANHASNTVTRSITIGAVNSAPVLANIEGTALAFAEGDAAKVITSTITVADADSANLASATVTISAGYQNGQDVLALSSPPAGIIPAFNAASGTLTLTGSASPATYETALRAVTFANGSNTPSTTTRTIGLQVNDGAAANNLSNVATRDITFAGVNDAPVLAGIEGAALTFTEGDAAKAVTSSITVADADSPNLASATVTISAGYQNGHDVLALPSPPVGITPSFDAASGTLTLSGSATLAAYQAALRGVTYANASESPSTAARTVSFRVDDGAAANNLSNTVTRNISVSSVNDAPVLANVEPGAITYTENDASTTLTETITVADADSTTLTGATVSVSTGFATGQDVLSFTDQLGITGSYNAGTGVLTLSGTASLTGYQTALRDVKYNNTSDNPSTAARTLGFRVNDGAAANNLSNIATRSITVVAVNDAPVLAGVEGTALGYTENDLPTAVSGAITVADPDNVNLTGATVVITTNFQNGQDVLSFTNQPGITGSFNAATGTMTLSGTTTVANYQTALRAVRYVNTSENPSALQRTISFRANDGAATNNLSNVVTRNLTVTPVNDNPVATNETFTGAIGNTKLAVGVSGQAGPVVEITGNVLGNDTDVDGPGPLTATLATPNPAGGRVVTMNTNGTFVYVPPPGLKGGNDSFTYTVSDGAGGTATGTITITIQNVLVWYVDASAPAGGLGRSTDPMQNMVTLRGPGDVDAPGDIIFLMGTATYTGGLPLENDQRLIGSPEGLVNIGTPPVTLVPANAGGTNPTITNSAGIGIPLAQNNTIRRVNVANTSSAGINGGAINTVDIGPNMTVSNSGGAGFALFGGGNGNVTFAANVIHSSLMGRSVFMGGRTGGTVTISGSVTDTGGGVLFDTNPGTTINVTGGLTIGPSNTDAFRAIGGGTVSVTGTNTLSSTGAVALEVTGTTIGSNGLTFQSINKNGGANGIVLNGTGSGFLTVTGTGSPVTAGSGGTIQNTTVDGISLTNVGGMVTLNGMATTTVAGTDVLVSGGGANVTYAGTINGSAGRSVSVANRTGGTVTFGGLVNDSGGTGISLTNNTGAAMNFTGGVTLSTGTNAAFTATGGGTVSVTGSANTITTTTGVGVNVTTTIGAGGITFRSVNVNGAANGIVLSNTGAGAFVVSGNGGDCTVAAPTCTGGTIQNTTGVGVQLANTTGASLTRVRILDTGSHGVAGTGVSSFTFANSINQGAGNGNDEDAFSFGTIGATNITGTLSITNSAVRKFTENGLLVRNATGSLAVTVTNTTFQDNDQEDGNFGANGLLIEGSGSAGINLNVTGSTFDQIESAAIQYEAEGTGTNDVNIIGNTFSHPSSITNFEVGGGVVLITDTNGTNPAELTFDVQGNYFNLISGVPVNVVGEGNADGRIGGGLAANPSGPGSVNQGNTIKQSGALNGCAEDAIRLDDDGNFHAGTSPVTTWRLLVQNNVIDAHNGVDAAGETLCPGRSGDQGIVVFLRDGAGTFHGTFTSNTVTDSMAQGMRVFIADRDGTDGVSDGPNAFLTVNNNTFANVAHTDGISMSVDDLADLCANVTGNSVDGNILLERRVGTSTFRVPQASTAAISAGNGGAPVTLGAEPLMFNTACNVVLPTNP